MEQPHDTLSEVAYQAELTGQLGPVTATADHILDRYRRCALWRLFPKEFMFKRLHEIGITGKEFLEFGCGEGVISTQLARLGARVTAVDISPELIARAEQRGQLDGISARITFMVRDIMRSPLEPNRFDVLLCYAVLHHVDTDLVPRLLASLKPGGLAIMVEPIAFSRSLQRLRDLLPMKKHASPDERQLSEAEIDDIAGRLVDREVVFFNLLGRFARFLPNRNKIDRGHPFTKTALIGLLGFDRLLLTLFPFLSRLCGTVVIVGRRRHRAQPQAHPSGAPANRATACPR